MDSGQVSLPVVEAGLGVVLVLSVAVGFALPVEQPADRDPQLTAYARDAGTVLTGEPPRHGGSVRLSEVVRSPEDFDRERDGLERRVDRILPSNLMYRIRTPHGTVGYHRPAGVAVGVATVTTLHGEVEIEVWYA